MSEIKELLTKLNYGKGTSRIEAALTLSDYHMNAESIALMAESLNRTTDDFVRATLITALQKAGPNAKDAIKSFVAALSSPRGDIRRAAMTAIGKLGSEGASAIPNLMPFLKHRDPWDRYRSVKALSDIGIDAVSAIPALIKLVDDEDINVQLVAIHAISSIDGSTPKTYEKLKEIAQTNNHCDVREAAVYAIERARKSMYASAMRN